MSAFSMPDSFGHHHPFTLQTIPPLMENLKMTNFAEHAEHEIRSHFGGRNEP